MFVKVFNKDGSFAGNTLSEQNEPDNKNDEQIEKSDGKKSRIKKPRKKRPKPQLTMASVIGILCLLAVSGIVAVFGYRVIVTAGEVPGKLTSISVAANNLNYVPSTMKKAQKVDYDTMKYGYMDGLMIASMDHLDRKYENQRMEEIRAVNDLTAMSLRTADRIAYEQSMFNVTNCLHSEYSDRWMQRSG